METINETYFIPQFEEPWDHRFTLSYLQPEEYHFCLDSIVFAKFVASMLTETAIDSTYRILDVCSGCGVIGLELSFLDERIHACDFMEIQETFRESFLGNLAVANRDRWTFRFLNQSYATLLEDHFARSYDLIIGNPPYFMRHEGLLSLSEMQNRCRFFLDSSLETLAMGVLSALSDRGSAFLLVKSGEQHGRDAISELKSWLVPLGGEADVVAKVRGTPVVHLRRRSQAVVT